MSIQFIADRSGLDHHHYNPILFILLADFNQSKFMYLCQMSVISSTNLNTVRSFGTSQHLHFSMNASMTFITRFDNF